MILNKKYREIRDNGMDRWGLIQGSKVLNESRSMERHVYHGKFGE